MTSLNTAAIFPNLKTLIVSSFIKFFTKVLKFFMFISQKDIHKFL